MKKPILGLLLGLVICVSTVLGFAWLVGELTTKQEVTAEVETPADLVVSASAISSKLTQVHGNAVSFYDMDGVATTNYYHETLTCTFDGEKTLYFDGITCDEDIAPALRVVIDKKIYAHEGFTTGLTVNSMPVTPATSGSLGTYTDTATLDVIVFLEGEDEACCNDNAVDSLDFELNFHVE